MKVMKRVAKDLAPSNTAQRAHSSDVIVNYWSFYQCQCLARLVIGPKIRIKITHCVSEEIRGSWDLKYQIISFTTENRGN